MPKIWVTKYACTRGIFEDDSEKYSSYKSLRKWYGIVETREEAVKLAEQARVRKIANLKKQIEKLEKKVF